MHHLKVTKFIPAQKVDVGCGRGLQLPIPNAQEKSPGRSATWGLYTEALSGDRTHLSSFLLLAS